jgi:hypothetical protein
MLDLVLLEQPGDAARQPGDDRVLPLHHLGQVELEVADDDPVAGELVLGLEEVLGGVEQGLGRDAPDVQAGAAEALILLDAGDPHAELGRADGGDVPAGAGADDDQVVGRGGGGVAHVRRGIIGRGREGAKGDARAAFAARGLRTAGPG